MKWSSIYFIIWILLLNFLIPHYTSLAIKLRCRSDPLCRLISHSVAGAHPSSLWFTIEGPLRL